MEQKRMNARYTLMQATYWCGYGIVWAYIGTLLLRFGFTSAAVGLITAASTLLSVFAAPLLSGWIDLSSRLSSRRGARAIALCTLVCALTLRFAPTTMLTRAALFILLGTALASSPPFLNAMAMEATALGIPIAFGFSRGVGSICYALASFSFGFYIETHEIINLLCFFSAVAAVHIFSLRSFGTDTQNRVPDESPSGTLALLRTHPHFTLTLCGCVFFFIAHTIGNIYMYEIVAHVGGTNSSIGIVLAISACMELPAMTLVSRLRRRIPCISLLCVSAVANVVKYTVFLFAPSVQVLYIGSVLQFFQFGVYLPATVYYVDDAIEDAHRVKGQSAIHVAGCGLGAALGSLIGGLVCQRYGIHATLGVSVASAFVGLLLFLLSAHWQRKRK